MCVPGAYAASVTLVWIIIWIPVKPEQDPRFNKFFLSFGMSDLRDDCFFDIMMALIVSCFSL